MISMYAPIIIGIITLLGGISFVIRSIVTMQLAYGAARSWPRAQGKVLKSSYKIANLGSVTSKNARSNSYILDFTYEYTIDGQVYSSNKPLFFGLQLIDEIKPFVERYPQDAEVEVYYDPRNHQRAVIETTLYGKSGKHEISMGLLFMLAGVILLSIRYEIISQWFI